MQGRLCQCTQTVNPKHEAGASLPGSSHSRKILNLDAVTERCITLVTHFPATKVERVSGRIHATIPAWHSMRVRDKNTPTHDHQASSTSPTLVQGKIPKQPSFFLQQDPWEACQAQALSSSYMEHAATASRVTASKRSNSGLVWPLFEP